MGTSPEIENIEQMRLREGIDDVDLREEVRARRAGDVVKITLLTGARPFEGETVRVRITSVRPEGFRGKLVGAPASARLAHLRAGSPVTFAAAHVHSVVKKQPARRR